ncbi:MAG: TRAM domain-containing protein [Candidatus Promineifilaceae bacterium]|nr:TRAM domain-containing protein [Candidatus Promineifilaceae bacterium]
MTELQLDMTGFAYGGAAIGHDKKGRLVFVQGAIPGERVRVSVTQDKGRYLHADLLAVIKPSKNRIQPRCPHFGLCSGCHYQHMDYQLQLRAKRDVVHDQLQRIGNLRKVTVRPVLPSPIPYAYAVEADLSRTEDGKLGYWSSKQRQVIPIKDCPILEPRLLALLQDIDLDLPGMRKLTLRAGSEEDLLAALEVDGIEPPELEVDFPVSVAIVLPDRNAASLIGDPFLIQEVKGHRFRVSPGCFFQPNIAAAELLIGVLLTYSKLNGTETVIEAYAGVGMLTAFLADRAQKVLAIEVNEDAAADFVANLSHTDHVSLYQGLVEEILPAINTRADLMVVNPGREGLTVPVIKSIADLRPRRLVYVSSEVGTVARDAKGLSRVGFRLLEVQPIDMMPQTYRIDTVSLWVRK